MVDYEHSLLNVLEKGSDPITAVGRNGKRNLGIAITVAAFLFSTIPFIPASARADDVIFAGLSPIAVAVNPITNRIYVANQDGGSVTVIDGSDNSTDTVTVKNGPSALAVNIDTNRIYVANSASNQVSVINGVTNIASTVNTGILPIALAVNPVTNKIYVTNFASATVTVINGANNSTSTVAVGLNPIAVAVNPVTNTVYVANQISNTVTVIDGTDNSTDTVAVGAQPYSIAVNPVSNKIFVANSASHTITIIDGSNNSTTSLPTGGVTPVAVAVNTVSNRVYVANKATANCSVFNGDTGTIIALVPTSGAEPSAIAINAVTNHIYVANTAGSTVAVIDGDNNTVIPAPAYGATPSSIAVNPITNRIYVANKGSHLVAALSGTMSTTSIATGDGPADVAVNPVTNRIYVPNYLGNSLTVINGSDNSTTSVPGALRPGGHPERPVGVVVNPQTDRYFVGAWEGFNVKTRKGSDNTLLKTTDVGGWCCVMDINPVTNRIYAAQNRDYENEDKLYVINGDTFSSRAVYLGYFQYPRFLQVNPVTNRIYIGVTYSGLLRIVDGSDLTVEQLFMGKPSDLAVNPVTNKIYVALADDGKLTIIDGSDQSMKHFDIGTAPSSLAVNTMTNRVFIGDRDSDIVTVLDGTDHSTQTVSVSNPKIMLANPVTNKTLVARTNGTVTIIDGVDLTVKTLSGGVDPSAMDFNPVTNRVYVSNRDSDNVWVYYERRKNAALQTTILPLPDNSSFLATPTFQFEAMSSDGFPVRQIYYQVDTWMGEWKRATPAGAMASGTTSPLTLGTHVIYAFAVDGQESTSVNSGFGNGPILGSIASYHFLVTYPMGKLEVSPLEYDFGARPVGDGPSPPVEFTITNIGNLNVGFTAPQVDLVGKDAGTFQIESDSGETELTPGQSRLVGVSFEPTTVGSNTAGLRVRDNDSLTPDLIAALSGRGVTQQIFRSGMENLSLLDLNFLPTGVHLFSAGGQTFEAYVEKTGAIGWLLVGRGREGWEFDADGPASEPSSVKDNLGMTAAFPPAALSDAIINDIIAQSRANLTDVEIRLKRAADIDGSTYQEDRWRPVSRTTWTWDFDEGIGYPVEHEIISSPLPLGTLGPVLTNTRDNQRSSSHRIFTFPWSSHQFQQGFSYGLGQNGVDNNSPTSFLWEATTEEHAIPYTEVYIRLRDGSE